MQLVFFPVVGIFNIHIDPQSNGLFITGVLMIGACFGLMLYKLSTKGPYSTPAWQKPGRKSAFI